MDSGSYFYEVDLTFLPPKLIILKKQQIQVPYKNGVLFTHLVFL